MNSEFLWEKFNCSCEMEDLKCLFLNNCLQNVEPSDLPSAVENQIIATLSWPLNADGVRNMSKDKHTVEDEATLQHVQSFIQNMRKSTDVPACGVKTAFENTKDKGATRVSSVSDVVHKVKPCLQKHQTSSAASFPITDEAVRKLVLTLENSKEVHTEPMSKVIVAKVAPQQTLVLTRRSDLLGTEDKLQSEQRAKPGNPEMYNHQNIKKWTVKIISNGGSDSPGISDSLRMSTCAPERSSPVVQSISEDASSETPRQSSRTNRGKRLFCNHCRRTFPSYLYLIRHKRIHARRMIRRCTRCGLSFRETAAFAAHKCNHSKAPTHTCRTCGHAFDSLTAWLKHQKIHSVPSQHMRTSESVSGLSSHKHDPSDLKNLPQKIFSKDCKFCGLTQQSYLELCRHEKTHNGEPKPYRCHLCDKRCSTRGSRDCHVNVHTGNKPFLCEVCGERYFSQRQLKAHCRVHSRDGPSTPYCSFCDKLFSNLGNLKLHIRRKHTGERPFICATCGKSFTAAGDLQVHMRTHTGQRPYKCDICDRTFITSSYRAEHVRSHAGERPYVCTICNKRFKLLRVFKSHMLIHSGERQFKCTVCSKTFMREHHLRVHRRTHKK